MTKLISTIAIVVLGLVALGAASRALVALAGALVVPIVALGLTACLVRIAWWLTGPR